MESGVGEAAAAAAGGAIVTGLATVADVDVGSGGLVLSATAVPAPLLRDGTFAEMSRGTEADKGGVVSEAANAKHCGDGA